MLEAMPTPDELGPGWTREEAAIFDAHDDMVNRRPEGGAIPSQFDKAKSGEPANFGAAVHDSMRNISGGARVHYRFQSAEGTNRYEVQLQRYRSKEQLVQDFDKVWALDSGRYERKRIGQIPALAIELEDRVTGSCAIWVRAAQFKATIAGAGGSWEEDGALRGLVEGLVRRMHSAKPTDQEADRISHIIMVSAQQAASIRRELESEQLRLDFVRWDQDSVRDREVAVLRLTNPGRRSVLIWNERVQVRAQEEAKSADEWTTVHSDYPTFDLPGALKGGQSLEFRWCATEHRPWRLCLLYSKDTATALSPDGTERFEDNYEVIGPVLGL
jgi:hypothetical protein